MTHEATALEALLDSVHAALQSGDFAALPALTEAVGALDEMALPRDPAALQALQRRLQRNNACLMASARGLRAARRRVAEITTARAGLQTYTQAGTRQQIGTTQGRLAQRF